MGGEYNECLSRSPCRRQRRDLRNICFSRLDPGKVRSDSVGGRGRVEYLCWDPTQAGVEDFTAYVEDHGICGRRGEGVCRTRRGAAKGMANGPALSLYIARYRLGCGQWRIVVPFRRTSPIPPVNHDCIGKPGLRPSGDLIGGGKTHGLCWGSGQVGLVMRKCIRCRYTNPCVGRPMYESKTRLY